jgi:hypothetical protein
VNDVDDIAARKWKKLGAIKSEFSSGENEERKPNNNCAWNDDD